MQTQCGSTLPVPLNVTSTLSIALIRGSLHIVRLRSIELQPHTSFGCNAQRGLTLTNLGSQHPTALSLRTPEIILQQRQILNRVPVGLNTHTLSQRTDTKRLIPLLRPFKPLLPIRANSRKLQTHRTIRRTKNRILRLLRTTTITSHSQPHNPPVSGNTRS